MEIDVLEYRLNSLCDTQPFRTSWYFKNLGTNSTIGRNDDDVIVKTKIREYEEELLKLEVTWDRSVTRGQSQPISRPDGIDKYLDHVRQMLEAVPKTNADWSPRFLGLASVMINKKYPVGRMQSANPTACTTTKDIGLILEKLVTYSGDQSEQRGTCGTANALEKVFGSLLEVHETVATRSSTSATLSAYLIQVEDLPGTCNAGVIYDRDGIPLFILSTFIKPKRQTPKGTPLTIESPSYFYRDLYRTCIHYTLGWVDSDTIGHIALDTAYTTATNLYMTENQMTWNRFNIMVTANAILGAVLGAAFASGSPDLGLLCFALALTLVGLVVCDQWEQMTIRGNAYHDVWRDAAFMIEKRQSNNAVQTMRYGQRFRTGHHDLLQIVDGVDSLGYLPSYRKYKDLQLSRVMKVIIRLPWLANRLGIDTEEPRAVRFAVVVINLFKFIYLAAAIIIVVQTFLWTVDRFDLWWESDKKAPPGILIDARVLDDQ